MDHNTLQTLVEQKLGMTHVRVETSADEAVDDDPAYVCCWIFWSGVGGDPDKQYLHVCILNEMDMDLCRKLTADLVEDFFSNRTMEQDRRFKMKDGVLSPFSW